MKMQGKNDIASFVRLPTETIRELNLFDGDSDKKDK